MIERLEINERMSRIVKVNGTVYLGGVRGFGDTIEEQTRDCLSTIDQLLETAGTDRAHVVRVIIWLADRENFDAMNSVYNNWFSSEAKPSRACTITEMAKEGMMLEMVATAVMPD